MRCTWMLPSLLSGGKEPSTAVSMHGGDSAGSHYHDQWQAGGGAATRSQQGHRCPAWTRDDPWVFNSRQPSAELRMLPGIQGRKANRKHLYSGLSLRAQPPGGEQVYLLASTEGQTGWESFLQPCQAVAAHHVHKQAVCGAEQQGEESFEELRTAPLPPVRWHWSCRIAKGPHHI